MSDLHFVVTTRFSTNDDLMPHTVINSDKCPYDYAVMTPDYKWHYYQSEDGHYGKQWKEVNITGEVNDN